MLGSPGFDFGNMTISRGPVKGTTWWSRGDSDRSLFLLADRIAEWHRAAVAVLRDRRRLAALEGRNQRMARAICRIASSTRSRSRSGESPIPRRAYCMNLPTTFALKDSEVDKLGAIAC